MEILKPHYTYCKGLYKNC